MQAKAMEVEVGLRKIADETYNIMQKNIREIERNSSEAKDM
jgi:formiminotetrahydrofolate cyclodeaminase